MKEKQKLFLLPSYLIQSVAACSALSANFGSILCRSRGEAMENLLHVPPRAPAAGTRGTTKSPGFKVLLSSSPPRTFSTIPAPSFPGVAGGRGAPGYVPSTTLMSDQLTGEASQRTSTEGGEGEGEEEEEEVDDADDGER